MSLQCRKYHPALLSHASDLMCMEYSLHLKMQGYLMLVGDLLICNDYINCIAVGSQRQDFRQCGCLKTDVQKRAFVKRGKICSFLD